jgi:hypothetical protein
VRYARLRATSPTYGAVTLIVVNEPKEEQFYVMCLDTAISGPRLIRAWKRRHWIEHCFRTLKHLLATGACQVHSEDAYYGHLVLRLMGCLVLFYASTPLLLYSDTSSLAGHRTRSGDLVHCPVTAPDI